MIAVAAPNADPEDVRAFMAEHYGDAPVEVFWDPTGRDYEELSGGRHPNSVFFDADGQRSGPPDGWPGSIVD